METQNKMILKALKSGEKLTGLEIVQRFNCLNYTGRISDLRREGHPIRTDMVKLRSGKYVGVYSIKNPELPFP